MRTRGLAKAVVLLTFAAGIGCATSRSEIKLGSPAVMPPGSDIASRQTAVIRSVRDERVFEQAPKDPSTPSLGFEGSARASAETKARAVGRKRNTYGKAIGDLLLEKGQTVEGVIRENLAVALEQAGYRVTGESDAGPSPLVLDVHIKQFWAWFQPGFWAVTLNADIVTDLDLSGASVPVTLHAHAEDSRQVATEGAWMEILGQALTAYRARAAAEAADFGKSGRGNPRP